MAVSLTLVQGATTLPLNSAGWALTDALWRPVAGDSADGPTVTETLALRRIDPTAAQVATAVRALSRVLDEAAHPSAEPVWLDYTPAGISGWRARVWGGTLTLRGLPTTGAPISTVFAEVTVMRGPWLSALPGDTVSATLDATHDLTRESRLLLPADFAPDGDRPAKLALTLTNTGSVATGRLWLGQAPHPGALTDRQITWEAEAATRTGPANVAPSAAATASAGQVVTFSTSAEAVFTWALNATQAGYLSGATMVGLLRLASGLAAGSAVEVCLCAKHGAVTLAAGEPVLIEAGRTVAEVGHLRLPVGLTTPITLELRITPRGAPVALSVDALHLLPAESMVAVWPVAGVDIGPGAVITLDAHGAARLDGAYGVVTRGGGLHAGVGVSNLLVGVAESVQSKILVNVVGYGCTRSC